MPKLTRPNNSQPPAPSALTGSCSSLLKTDASSSRNFCASLGKKLQRFTNRLGHPKLIQLSSKKSFPDLKEEPVQISHGIPSFHHSALRSFSDEAIDMAISSILVLIVSILRSSKGRSVSQNAWGGCTGIGQSEICVSFLGVRIAPLHGTSARICHPLEVTYLKPPEINTRCWLVRVPRQTFPILPDPGQKSGS